MKRFRPATSSCWEEARPTDPQPTMAATFGAACVPVWVWESPTTPASTERFAGSRPIPSTWRSSPGVLTIDGDYLQGEDGTLIIEIGGTTADTEYDVVAVSYL